MGQCASRVAVRLMIGLPPTLIDQEGDHSGWNQRAEKPQHLVDKAGDIYCPSSECQVDGAGSNRAHIFGRDLAHEPLRINTADAFRVGGHTCRA